MLGTVAVGNKTVGKEQAGWKLGQVYRREISFVTATEGKRWGALETSVGGGKKLELNKEREELRVIKEEQEKKKKIAAAQYWHCAPPQTQAREAGTKKFQTRK